MKKEVGNDWEEREEEEKIGNGGRKEGDLGGKISPHPDIWQHATYSPACPTFTATF